MGGCVEFCFDLLAFQAVAQQVDYAGLISPIFFSFVGFRMCSFSSSSSFFLSFLFFPSSLSPGILTWYSEMFCVQGHSVYFFVSSSFSPCFHFPVDSELKH